MCTNGNDLDGLSEETGDACADTGKIILQPETKDSNINVINPMMVPKIGDGVTSSADKLKVESIDGTKENLSSQSVDSKLIFEVKDGFNECNLAGANSKVASAVGDAIGNEIGSIVGENIEKDICSAGGDKKEKEISSAIFDDQENRFGSIVRENLEKEIASTVADDRNNDISSAVGDNKELEIASAVADDRDNDISSAVGDNKELEIASAVADDVGNDIDSSVSNNSEKKISLAVADNQINDIGLAVGANKEKEIDSAIVEEGDNIGAAVSDNIRKEISADVVDNGDNEIDKKNCFTVTDTVSENIDSTGKYYGDDIDSALGNEKDKISKNIDFIKKDNGDNDIDSALVDEKENLSTVSDKISDTIDCTKNDEKAIDKSSAFDGELENEIDLGVEYKTDISTISGTVGERDIGFTIDDKVENKIGSALQDNRETDIVAESNKQVNDIASTVNDIDTETTSNSLIVDNKDEKSVPNIKQEASVVHTDTSEDPGPEEATAESPNAAFNARDKIPQWMNILGHDRLRKKTIKRGKGYFTRPTNGQRVTICYSGAIKDGPKYQEDKEITFTLGDGDVLQAFDLSLALMELGETCIVETHSDYAYGTMGRAPDIPGDASLVFTVELLKVEDAPEYNRLGVKERLEAGVEKREIGNWWYCRNDYTFAIQSYNKALSILNEGSTRGGSIDDLAKLKSERIKCYNNLSVCQLKIDAFSAAISSCDSALSLEPANVKAHYRKGKALAGKGEIRSAISSYRKAIKIEPDSKLLCRELNELVAKHKKETDTEKRMYQRMIGTDKPKPSSKTVPEWLIFTGFATATVIISAFLAYKYTSSTME